MARSWVFVVAVAGLVACSNAENKGDEDGGNVDDLAGADLVGTIDLANADLANADLIPAFDCTTCGDDEACTGSGCSAPTQQQLDRVAALAEYVDTMAAVTAYPYSYDRAAIKQAGKLAILHGPDTEMTYLTAMRGAFLAIPEGHQSMYLKSGCGTKLQYGRFSLFGACVRPSDDGLVVVQKKSGANPLGLELGDEIVSGDGKTRDALLADAYRRPLCDSTYPSLAAQVDAAAASFLSTAPAGMTLRVRAPDGAMRTITIPATANTKLDCNDVFGRSAKVIAEATTLADGTAVIRLPSFVPYDVPFPNTTDPAVLDAYQNDFIARIKAVFDTVKTAPRIVWDVRGNGGGLTRAGLAIASGMPGAQSTLSTYCTARIADSEPAAYYADHYATYGLTPGGDFLYTGKVAVLVDGLGYSATDYFAYFVKHATSATLVGTTTAGAFGGSSASFDITSATPALTFYYDINRCARSEDDTALETHGTEPHLVVRYTPGDLAAGRDTVLEAAIAALKN